MEYGGGREAKGDSTSGLDGLTRWTRIHLFEIETWDQVSVRVRERN